MQESAALKAQKSAERVMPGRVWALQAQLVPQASLKEALLGNQHKVKHFCAASAGDLFREENYISIWFNSMRMTPNWSAGKMPFDGQVCSFQVNGNHQKN